MTIMLLIDRRRRNRIEDEHKKIIKNNVGELHKIYVQAALDVNRLETDEEAVSEHLSKYMRRKYSRIEHAMDIIEIHRAQRINMSETEKCTIDQLIDSSRTILDTYCPRDISESRWANRWKDQTKFREHYKKIIEMSQKINPK